MIKNKAYLPIYQKLNAMSTQLSKRTNNFIEYNSPRYIPLRSAMFSCEALNKKKKIDLQNYRKINQVSMFSMDKTNYQKYKYHRQLLENAKLPIFNAKKQSQQSFKRKKEYIRPRQVYSQQHRKSTEKKSKQKQSWQNYLNEQNIMMNSSNGMHFMSKKMFFGKEKQKFRRSQMKYDKRQIKNDIQIQNFYANNFIKTRYRRKIFQNKKKDKNGQNMHQCHIQVQKIFNNTKGPSQENWVVPWQKHAQIEDEYYTNNFNNEI